MIFSAESFSQFEKCPRFPQLYRTYEPPQWPIRDAVKQFFEMGIRGIMAGESPELTVQSFLAKAANPGYTYPEGDHYSLAHDHASWLEGALQIIKEENPNLEQLPIYSVGNYQITVEGWDDGEKTHIFRAASNTRNRTLRWPELVLLAMDGREVQVHVFNFPSVRDGRLVSPLSMAYRHPTFKHVQYRLARLYDDPEFSSSWKKEARWEIQPNPTWEEWKLGIERDQCIDKIRENYVISPTLDSAERDRLLFDIEQMAHAQEMPSIYPRYRESCQSCIFNKLCHGSADDRNEYKVRGPEEISRILNFPLDTLNSI